MLVRQLPMAVVYDPAALDPASSAIADRLRKQAKTRAIKLLREVLTVLYMPVTVLHVPYLNVTVLYVPYLMTSACRPRPEPGRDCLTCAIFAR